MNRPMKLSTVLALVLAGTALAEDAAQKPAPAPQDTAKPAVTVAKAQPAAKAPGEEPIVSMVFDETPLSDVIKAFRDATGANIITSTGSTNLAGTVSVRLDNVPWRQGLNSILAQYGQALQETPPGSGIYTVAPVAPVAVPLYTRTFTLNYAKADDVAKLINDAFSKGSAVPFPAANSIVVKATKEQLDECESILKSVDKAPPQVYIEARFVELSADASKKLGVNFEDSLGGNGIGINSRNVSIGFNEAASHTKKITGTTGFSQSGTYTDGTSSRPLTTALSADSGTATKTSDHSHDHAFTGTLSANDFAVAINAFEKMNGVSIFSNPRVIVANEETALVDMTTKFPNVEVTSSRTGTTGDQLDITAKLTQIPGEEKQLFAKEAFFSWGIQMQVVPRVSPNGEISVTIEPSISSLDTETTVDGFYSLGNSASEAVYSKYPIIFMQRIQTVFTMKDGTTAVIGGLTKTTESNIDSGIPLLRKIPWLGPRVFGWKSRQKIQKEIIIFVTVGIANPDAMPETIGLPKNAVLGRGLFTGDVKEPGDRKTEDVLNLEDPAPMKGDPLPAASKPAEPAPAPKADPAPAPKAGEPLLKQ